MWLSQSSCIMMVLALYVPCQCTLLCSLDDYKKTGFGWTKFPGDVKSRNKIQQEFMNRQVNETWYFEGGMSFKHTLWSSHCVCQNLCISAKEASAARSTFKQTNRSDILRWCLLALQLLSFLSMCASNAAQAAVFSASIRVLSTSST